MVWTPRSQRIGSRNYDGPFEGVPDHLRPQLIDWLSTSIRNERESDAVTKILALRLHIELDFRYGLLGQLELAGASDDDLLLDITEGVMLLTSDGDLNARRLKHLLEISGSKYTVMDRLIVDAVGPEMQETYDGATATEDEASANVQEAWSKAFGRSPDPSDAWDHAIKAVECVLQPIVEPANSKSTLGSVIGILSTQGSRWRGIFPGVNKDGAVENMVAMLRLLWPNPDRHGSNSRKPTLEESRAVVTLAASIVQWHREGKLLEPR